MKTLAITSSILCDDIRTEKTNKHILVGVFSGDIIIPSVPSHLDIAIYVAGDTIGGRPSEIWFRISGPGEGVAVLRTSVTGPSDQTVAVFATPKLHVLMESEGTFRVEISDDNKVWEQIIEKRVIVNPDADYGPIVFEQPPEQSPSDAPASS